MRVPKRQAAKETSKPASPLHSAAPTCHHCGKAYYKATAKFCSHCGEKKLMQAAAPMSFQNKHPPVHSDGSGKKDEPLRTIGVAPQSATVTTPQAGASVVPTLPPSPEGTLNALKLPPARPFPSQRFSTSSAESPRGGGRKSPSPSLKAGAPVAPNLPDSVTLPKDLESTRSKKGSHTKVDAMEAKESSGPSQETKRSVTPERSSSRESHLVTPPIFSSKEKKSKGHLQTTGKENPAARRSSMERRHSFTDLPPCDPKKLTPQMLMTANHEELAEWKKGTFIGRGTFGSVYLGLLGDGSFYAVKCVELGRNPSDALDPSELMALHREITVMQQLKHPNLCEFKGVWYDAAANHICMFMQYIGGGSLSSFVKKFKPLPPDVVRSWTKQLLCGLSYLHSRNIIHRDIKGENVLVDTSLDPSSGAQIKLVDFGAARRLTDAVSQSRTVIGTPYWMAPEVVMSGDGGGYSFKADVWSVGCTVAEMLTGSPPWPTRTNAPATILMIATSKSGPTQIPEKEATPGCLDFMQKCFERDPDNRYSVDQLLQHPWILGEME